LRQLASWRSLILWFQRRITSASEAARFQGATFYRLTDGLDDIEGQPDVLGGADLGFDDSQMGFEDSCVAAKIALGCVLKCREEIRIASCSHDHIGL
jgi:hypothetical protein